MDANVLVSGLMVTAGPPARVINEWRAGRYQLITSTALIAELTDVLGRRRIARRIREPTAAAELVDELVEFGEIVTPSIMLDIVERDPDDNRVLEAAVAGGADAIVSGDRDLLSLRQYDGIPIVTAVQFLAMLAEAQGPDGRET